MTAQAGLKFAMGSEVLGNSSSCTLASAGASTRAVPIRLKERYLAVA